MPACGVRRRSSTNQMPASGAPGLRRLAGAGRFVRRASRPLQTSGQGRQPHGVCTPLTRQARPHVITSEGVIGLMDDKEANVVSAPMILECSRDGALLLETDYSGERVRVQLEPDALAWPMEVLANRIVRLHRVALMRARADQRLAEDFVALGLPPSRGWPSHADVEEYRRSAIDF